MVVAFYTLFGIIDPMPFGYMPVCAPMKSMMPDKCKSLLMLLTWDEAIIMFTYDGFLMFFGDIVCPCSCTRNCYAPLIWLMPPMAGPLLRTRLWMSRWLTDLSLPPVCLSPSWPWWPPWLDLKLLLFDKFWLVPRLLLPVAMYCLLNRTELAFWWEVFFWRFRLLPWLASWPSIFYI